MPQFSPSLISRLMSPSTPSAPANSTDELVRRRLSQESAALRSKEAEILSSISAALEKENLDKEKPGMSSDVLGRDIEEVREKVERMAADRANKETDALRAAKASVVACYR
jgi:altered-inheritance-of-mitochondria protein 13